MLGDAEGEPQIASSPRVGCALGHDLESHVVDHRVVAALHQQAAGDRLHGQARRARIGQAAGQQQAQVLLRRDDGARSSVASGAMMTSVKMLDDLFAASASSVRLSATMPPKAETGSQASALR
jgi:hypothetical protein